MEDSCIQRPVKKQASAPKQASGISVFLLEELGDARLRCAQLKKYVDEAVTLINKSKYRDHFFEVAAHLIYGIPDTLMRMDKALSAAALAASKLDYEEIKDTLRPEKVEQLEDVFEDIRIRRVKKQSEGAMKIPEAVARLEKLATETESTGRLDQRDMIALIYDLETPTNKEAAEKKDIPKILRDLAASLSDTDSNKERPSRLKLASTLRAVLAESLEASEIKVGASPIRYNKEMVAPELSDVLAQVRRNLADIEEDYIKDVYALFYDIIAMRKRGGRGPLSGMSQSLVNEADNILNLVERIRSEITLKLIPKIKDFDKNLEDEYRVREAEEMEEGRHEWGKYATEEKESEEEKQSRFEEGKPADPTKNMSPEDAKKWKTEHEKNKDKFKKKTAEDWKVKKAYRGDPRWITARYPGYADDGTPFKKGDLVLYWPRTKTFMVGKKAQDAWRRFESEVMDEEIYSGTYR